jgi:hypothetical protein
VNGWARKVSDGFMLAEKVPQLITHEKVLQDCDSDLKHFLEPMDLMGAKLGPLLFQFGYFNKQSLPAKGDDGEAEILYSTKHRCPRVIAKCACADRPHTS